MFHVECLIALKCGGLSSSKYKHLVLLGETRRLEELRGGAWTSIRHVDIRATRSRQHDCSRQVL